MQKIKIIYFLGVLTAFCAINNTVNAQVARQQRTERTPKRETASSIQNQRAKYLEIVNKSKKVSDERAKKANENHSNVSRANPNRPATLMAKRTPSNSRQSYQQLVQNLRKEHQSTQVQQPNRSFARNSMTTMTPQEKYKQYIQKAEADKQQIEKDRMNRMQ